MASESTAKMLAKMAGNKKPDAIVSVDVAPNEVFSTPQLTPSSEMEHILTNILGPNSSKNNTILD